MSRFDGAAVRVCGGHAALLSPLQGESLRADPDRSGEHGRTTPATFPPRCLRCRRAFRELAALVWPASLAESPRFHLTSQWPESGAPRRHRHTQTRSDEHDRRRMQTGAFYSPGQLPVPSCGSVQTTTASLNAGCLSVEKPRPTPAAQPRERDRGPPASRHSSCRRLETTQMMRFACSSTCMQSQAG
jgi:hypothetical protein